VPTSYLDGQYSGGGRGPDALRRRFLDAYGTEERRAVSAELLPAEHRSQLDSLRPLLRLDVRATGSLLHVTASPAQEAVVDRGARPPGLSADLDLGLLRRSAVAEQSLPALKLLVWTLVEQWRRATRHLRPRTWHPHRIGNARPPSPEDMAAWIARSRPLARDARLEALLADGRDALLVGPPGSGKTTSALRVASRLYARGSGLVWLDLTDPADGVESLLMTLLTAPARPTCVVVVENLQANVSAGAELYPMVDWLRRRLGLKLSVLATGWESVRNAQLNLPPAIRWLHARGDDVLSLLVEDVGEQDRPSIMSLARGDLVLAEAALAFYRRHGRVPDGEEMVATAGTMAGADRLADDPEARRWLYWFACLGMFEIGVPRGDCERILPRSVLDTLQSRGLLHKDDESMSVGHRSLADLLVQYAVSRQPEWSEQELQPPSQVAFEYLQHASTRQIHALLEKLDLVAADGSGSARLLAAEWRLLGILGEMVAHHVENVVPIFGGDVEACVDAGIALAALGLEYPWELTAKVVRDLLPLDGLESGAWLRVRPLAGPPGTPERRAGELGLLLAFEYAALKRDTERQAALARLALREADPHGTYQFHRTVFPTARILIGLGRGAPYVAGLDDKVRAARDRIRETLLRDPAGLGGISQIAACTIASISAGTSLADPSVEASCDQLWELRAQWSRPGRQAEAAWAVEALVTARRHIGDLHPFVHDLLRWAVDEDHWTDQEPSDLQLQRERYRTLARIAAALAGTVPALITSGLENALADIAHSGPQVDRAAVRQAAPYRIRLRAEDDALPAAPGVPVALSFVFGRQADREAAAEQEAGAHREVDLFVIAAARDSRIEVEPRMAHVRLADGATGPCVFTVTVPAADPPAEAGLVFEVYRCADGALVQQAAAVLQVRPPGDPRTGAAREAA